MTYSQTGLVPELQRITVSGLALSINPRERFWQACRKSTMTEWDVLGESCTYLPRPKARDDTFKDGKI